jgi:hypothetical protein
MQNSEVYKSILENLDDSVLASLSEAEEQNLYYKKKAVELKRSLQSEDRDDWKNVYEYLMVESGALKKYVPPPTGFGKDGCQGKYKDPRGPK